MRAVTLVFLLVFSASASAELTIERLIEGSRLEESSVPSRDISGWTSTPTIIVPEDLVASLTEEFPAATFLGAATTEAAANQAADAHAILRYCSDEVVENAPSLVWMQIYSSGSERCLRVERIGSGDVLLTNMQKMTSPAIGEHAIAMMLALGRQLFAFADNMDEGSWGREPSQLMSSVEGQTMLVLGLGGIGNEVAKRGHGLGMNVIATRNSSRSGPDYVDYVGLSDELLELAARADVIVCALPLTDSTRGLLDEEFFAAAKPGSMFINVSRGAIVDTDALLAALQSGHVRAAGLDVTEPEPLPSEHPLWQMDNVIITPHVAWGGSKVERRNLLLRENIRRFIAGEPMLNVVDPAAGY